MAPLAPGASLPCEAQGRHNFVSGEQTPLFLSFSAAPLFCEGTTVSPRGPSFPGGCLKDAGHGLRCLQSSWGSSLEPLDFEKPLYQAKLSTLSFELSIKRQRTVNPLCKRFEPCSGWFPELLQSVLSGEEICGGPVPAAVWAGGHRGQRSPGAGGYSGWWSEGLAVTGVSQRGWCLQGSVVTGNSGHRGRRSQGLVVRGVGGQRSRLSQGSVVTGVSGQRGRWSQGSV